METNRDDSARARGGGSGKSERASGERTGRGRNRRKESERFIEKITRWNNRDGIARDAEDVNGCGTKKQRGNGRNELDKNENIGPSGRKTKG